MRRLLFVLLAATVAGGLAYGAAASLSVSARGLGAGNSQVATCMGEEILQVDFLLNEEGQVAGIRLLNLEEACDGQNLSFVLGDDAAALEGGSGGGTIDLDDELPDDFDTESAIDPADVQDVAITIGGIPTA